MIGEAKIELNRDGSNYINIKLIDGSKIEISGNCLIDTVLDNKNNIISVSFDDLLYEVGDFIEFKININYKLPIKKIKKIGNTVKIFTTNINKSRIFGVPCLGNDKGFFSYGRYFVDSFMFKEKINNDEKQQIYLLYRSDNTDDYIELENGLFNHPYYIKSYDFNYSDLLIEFRIPSKYKDDIEKFLNGKYSEFSKNYLRRMLMFFKGDSIICSFINKIVLKDKEYFKERYPDLLTKDELSTIEEVISKPSLEEIFN